MTDGGCFLRIGLTSRSVRVLLLIGTAGSLGPFYLFQLLGQTAEVMPTGP